eukprot:328695-Lingulodinium_polyedra.AAC.1
MSESPKTRRSLLFSLGDSRPSPETFGPSPGRSSKSPFGKSGLRPQARPQGRKRRLCPWRCARASG